MLELGLRFLMCSHQLFIVGFELVSVQMKHRIGVHLYGHDYEGHGIGRHERQHLLHIGPQLHHVPCAVGFVLSIFRSRQIAHMAAAHGFDIGTLYACAEEVTLRFQRLPCDTADACPPGHGPRTNRTSHGHVVTLRGYEDIEPCVLSKCYTVGITEPQRCQYLWYLFGREHVYRTGVDGDTKQLCLKPWVPYVFFDR